MTSTYTADLNKVIFKNNVFTGNFFTGGKSLIHLEGVPRVFFSDEAFTNNGDSCKEAISTYGSGVMTQAVNEMRISDALSNAVAYPGSGLGRSLISISRSLQVSFTNMDYNGNW